jgi:hypothetical protein
MGRFPVTLYKEQWLKLLNMADDLRAFIAAKAELERLRNENAALKKGASAGIRLKVSVNSTPPLVHDPFGGDPRPLWPPKTAEPLHERRWPKLNTPALAGPHRVVAANHDKIRPPQADQLRWFLLY